MERRFAKPTKFDSSWFDTHIGGADPAVQSRLMHETARSFLNRVRESEDPETVERVIQHANESGIDDFAELWSQASPRTLAGALWRVYMLRALVSQQTELTALEYREGEMIDDTIAPVVAGAVEPTGPEEILALSNEILRGVFAGDFAIALDRSAAFARVVARGALELAAASDASDEARATRLTVFAARLRTTADELSEAAGMWRDDRLN